MPDERTVPRPSARREFLRDHTEVTQWTNRELLIRAVDATLDQAEKHGRLMAEVVKQGREHQRLVDRVDGIDERVRKVEHKLDMSQPEPLPSMMRNRTPSLQDLVGEMRQDIIEAVEEATSPGVEKRNDSDRVQKAIERREVEADAKHWREHEAERKALAEENRRDRRGLIVKAAGSVLVVIVLGVLGFVWYGVKLAAEKTLEHDKGVSEGKAQAPVMIVPIPASTATVEPPVILSPPLNAPPKRRP